MPGIPSFDNPITYFGVLFTVVGFYLTLSGFGILTIPSFSASQGIKSWGTGLFLIILGLVVLFGFIPYTGKGSSNDSIQEISILECIENPAGTIANADQPIAIRWGWSMYSDADRQKIFQLSSHIVTVDGKAQDVSKAAHVFSIVDGNYKVTWTLALGNLQPGIHEIRLIRILSAEFTDADGTTPAGPQEPEICQLTVGDK